MGNQIYFKIAGQVDLDILNMFAVSTYHLSLIVFEIKDEKYLNFENLMKKREITPKWVMGFTSKLQGGQILICRTFFQFKVNLYLLQFLKYKTKSIKFYKFDEKKGNNSKMGNQIYFKIAGQVDLDVLIIFTPCQIFDIINGF